MITALVIASTMTASYPYSWAPGLADPHCTINDVCPHENPVTRKRPNDSYTNRLKRRQIKDHNIDCSKGCEEDHVISIELCGSTTDPLNLSPEPYEPRPGAHEKDAVEDYLHREVCAGRMPIEEAQDMIRMQWLQIYESLNEKR